MLCGSKQFDVCGKTAVIRAISRTGIIRKSVNPSRHSCLRSNLMSRSNPRKE